MGNQKQKWTAEEEDALQRGVQKHGVGKWKNILRDPELGLKLASRSNIDLKDKWRNLNVTPGQDKNRIPKIKQVVSSTPITVHVPVNATHSSALQNVAVSPQFQIPTHQPSTNEDEAKIYPKYNEIIFEALSTIKDPNGSDLNAIISFIEQKQNIPQFQNFRRTLGAKLRRLVIQGKLEKVQNSYKIMDTSVGTKPADNSNPPPPPPQLQPREMGPPAPSNTLTYNDAMKMAAETVAHRISDAENKSYLAAAAVKDTERYEKLEEENDAMLKFAEELLEKCTADKLPY